jgi:hypothetical protein
MYASRMILSAIVLIITNLIVGSISLSLGLIVTVVLMAVLAVALALLTLLGFAVAMERMNWVRQGWTDAKIDRVKAWATRSRDAMPDWYRIQKRRILDLLIEALKERETRPPESARLTALKSIVAGLLVLLSVTLLTHSVGMTVGWSLGLTAFGALVLSVPLMHIRSRMSQKGPEAQTEMREAPAQREGSPRRGESEEDAEVWRAILALHRSGRLEQLLEEAPTAPVTPTSIKPVPEDSP